MSGAGQKLNSRQRRAVNLGLSKKPKHRVVAVVAGPGTGKTACLSQLVEELVSSGVPQERILVLAFTRRAKVELVTRLGHVHTRRERPVQIATFHAFAWDLIQRNFSELGFPSKPGILEPTETNQILKRLTRKLSKHDIKIARLSSVRNLCNNTLCDLSDVLHDSYHGVELHKDDFQRIFDTYQRNKQKRNTLDYDDLLIFGCQLLDSPALRHRIRRRYDHILVDEFQDVSPIQVKMLKLIRSSQTRLFLIGDPGQAIYNWRGATVNVFDELSDVFGIKPIRVSLLENYRSTRQIIALTNELNKSKVIQLSSQNSRYKPELKIVENQKAQARRIVMQVRRAAKSGMALSRQAVLYRTGREAVVFEQELKRHKILYTKIGAKIGDGDATGLNFEQREDVGANALTLSTIHAAKGREWDQVYIANCNEGYMPLARNANAAGLSEERRILFVGASRAKKRLYLYATAPERTGGTNDHSRHSAVTRFLTPNVLATMILRQISEGRYRLSN